MGLLDEAIREHLQLKRQHGADPTELARLEREALGPAVRETQEVLDTPPTAPATAPVAEAPGQATAPFDAEQAFAEESNGSAPEAAAPMPEPAEPPPTPFSQPAAASTDPVAPVEPVPAPDPEPFDPAPAAEPPATPGIEPDIAPESEPPLPPAAQEPEEGEDVLEETPDFLQETPEHDRLWFEQKPPRDFDFDS